MILCIIYSIFKLKGRIIMKNFVKKSLALFLVAIMCFAQTAVFAAATEEVVRGFEIGAADYLKKPFALDELILRIRALVGRSKVEKQEEAHYTIGLYSFDPQKGCLSLGVNVIKLSSREAEVLRRLAKQEGKIVESSALLKELWGDDSFFNMRSLNVFISRLRHHLSADPKVQILNIRGVGYRLIIDR